MKNNGYIIWIMGLAGSGKTTIGKNLYNEIKKNIPNVVYLDGDELRDIIGFHEYDKQSRIDVAIKRSKIANFLSNQGIIVIVTTISMFKEVYEFNRSNIDNYIEVYIECSMDELIKRNQKGLYSSGSSNVVGIDIDIDIPNCDIKLINTKPEQLKTNSDMLAKLIHKLVIK